MRELSTHSHISCTNSPNNLASQLVLFTILDIPGLPFQDEEPTPCNEKDGSFCFGFKLPKQHPCSRHTTTQYWLRYPSSCKRLKQPKPLSCSIGNNEGTVRCKDQFLDYCSNSTLKDCWDDLRLQGQNKLGFSKILYFNLNPGITGE